MKILIADDEAPVRASIRSLVHWEDVGCEIVGEASNGEETLELVGRERPDLLLLDLNMPRLSGIEVLARLGREYPGVVTVVISCHEEFDLVRQALLSGAKDYLLKHALKSEDLLRIIGEYRGEAGGSSAEGPRPGLREAISGALGGLGGDEGFGELGAGFEQVYAILFFIDRAEEIRARYTNRPPHFLSDTVVDVAAKSLFYLKHLRVAAYGEREERFAVLVGGKTPPGEPDCLQTAHRIGETLKKYLNLEIVQGVSEAYGGERRFSSALLGANAALRRRFFDEDETVLVSRPADPGALRPEVSQAIDAAAVSLRAALKSGDGAAFSSALSGMAAALRPLGAAGAGCVKSFLKLKIQELYGIGLDDALELAERIDGAQSLSGLCGILLEQFRASDASPRLRVESRNYLVREAADYLRANYSAPLSLEQIAEHLHVSESYISRLFKNEAGIGIIRYLNLVRIEQAKRLLRDHTLRQYQVAELVGFNNHIYFDSVFKSLEGVSPSEYRRSLR